jgi:ribulose-phosphate 3-epimerase
VLSADFGRLAEEVAAAERGGAARIHVDVMDGRFVPEITMGPLIARAVRRATRLPVDVHLMIVEPERHLRAFADAGAASIALHVEACPHLFRAVEAVRSVNVLPVVALNPATPPSAVEWVLPNVYAVLVMTVEPGSGGQPFIPAMRDKVALLDEWRRARGWTYEIAVDGGIAPSTAREVVAAGASILVAGTAIFGMQEGVATAIRRLSEAAGPAAPR